MPPMLATPKLEETYTMPHDEDEKKASPSPMQESKPSPKPGRSTTSVSNCKPGPQLIGHLPRAEADAMQTFEELRGNHYQYSTLGRSREALESMSCDCQYDHGEDDPSMACGDGSDCINRLTQVECLEEDCRCRSHCQNQRFRLRQYSDIEVVQTEKKGFGLRAATDIKKDAFIYEYIGDVVSQPSFAKRMRDYAAEGIRHFYFMMLQKDEFIDATKRGGIGRFANHSCSPNCYVAKWTVGKYVRMGIFSKRNIQKDEEITFNYNVDRYGHEAQTCYCGEPNCVGFIGGKTQTDVAAMDDLYLDALGITDEVETLGLKGNKKKKGKKLDEDYTPVLRPLLEKDVPKVVQAVRQTQSRKVLSKLLTRIKITDDLSALRQLMRLRGFSLMCNILVDFSDDVEINMLVLECIYAWPLLQRNKVEDSKIEEPVQLCTKSENEKLRVLAEQLLAQWATLEVGYRIPKRLKLEGGGADTPTETVFIEVEDELPPMKRTRLGDLHDGDTSHLQHLKPLGMTGTRTAPVLLHPTAQTSVETPPSQKSVQQSRQEIAEIIAAASRAAEEAQKAAAAAAATAKPEELKKKSSSGTHGSKSNRKLSKEDKMANKEKKLLKLVGAVVVKCMSKHQKQMDHEVFKKHAKELTHVIAEKEKKSQSYQSGKLDSLSDEKVVKIKKFAKDYIAKVLRKIEKSEQKRHASASTPSNSDTHDALGGSSTGNGELNVEDTLDLEDDDAEEPETEDPSPATEPQGPEPDVSVMDVDEDSPQFLGLSEPIHDGREESGWDPNRPKAPDAFYAVL